MTEKEDLLIEIGTEELPPKALPVIITAFADGVNEELVKAKLSHNGIKEFASPRRLAIIISDLDTQQPDIENNRRGPALSAAFDESGKPTPAATGFAKSCGVKVENLTTQKTEKGEWLYFTVNEAGQDTVDLIPDIVNKSLVRLPVQKRMRWGMSDIEFIRPVHWTIALLGDELIKCEILGVSTNNFTFGHRFHCPQKIILQKPADYPTQLESTGKVIAEFARRKELIAEKVNEAASKNNGAAVVNPELLNEVTALTEWPMAITGNFDEKFLKLPSEVLIASMQDHQKYFPVIDRDNKLTNCFIAVSNIESSEPEVVQAGNERVIHPRLSDAEFFWQRDTKNPLIDRHEELKHVIFQQDLGTLSDKTDRIKTLSGLLAQEIGLDVETAERSAILSKCDLLTDMVGEFPELQGTMGKYYALENGEPAEVAHAIEEHYMPRQAGADVPQSGYGQILALADKMDTLAGLFGIGQQPTGEKDPFGLRRAALGVIRILIEKDLAIPIDKLIDMAFNCFKQQIADANTDLETFIFDRLSGYLKSLGYTTLEIDAVVCKRPVNINLVHRQLEAVRAFNKLPEAESLVAANKRVVNILKQAEANGESFINADPKILKETAERNLFEALQSANDKALTFFDQGNFIEYLNSFAILKTPVDDFFDSVMVMADEPKLRENRLAMLADLREAMNKVADVSRLQG